jgi:hypothetical protein
MISLKKLLLENPEANPDDIFGEYIFGALRIDEPAASEINTDEEFEFQKSLKNHYVGDVYNQRLNNFLPTIFELINSGKYLDFLMPDKKYKHAYRLMISIPIEKAGQLFGINFLEIKNDKPFGLINKEIVYEPQIKQNNMSSWTIKLHEHSFEAITLDQKSIKDTSLGQVFVMLHANIDDNKFILNPEKINEKTKNLMPYNEWEVLSYGDVIVDKFSYVIIDYENSAKFEELRRSYVSVTFRYQDIVKKLIDNF